MSDWVEKSFSLKKTTKFAQTVVIEHELVDVNKDGLLDIVATYFWSPEKLGAIPVRVAINKGNGTFKEQAIFGNDPPVTGHPTGILKEDFNGDGRPDLFIYDVGPEVQPVYPFGQNQLMLSSGASGFVNATDRLPQVKEYNHCASAGDIDHDGDIDLFVAITSTSYFLINDGAANFTRTDGLVPWDNTVVSPIYNFTASVMFDANGDGWDDLFLGRASGSPDNHSLLLINDKSGSFAGVTPIQLPLNTPQQSYVQRAYAADFTGDGAEDLLLSFTQFPDFVPAYIQLFVNDGSGQFRDETAARLSPAALKTGVHVAAPVDINGDGYLDIALTDGRESNPGPLYVNDGTGHFINMPSSFLPQPGDVQRLGIGDVDKDGRADFVGVTSDNANETTYKVWLWQDPGRKINGTGKVDGLLGDQSKELIAARGGKDVVLAAGGNDKVRGGGGNDYLNGGDGNDRVDGEGGRDAIVGGLGKDKLTGGSGKDTFKFNSIAESVAGSKHDTILDFKGDRIDLSFIDANAVIAGDQAFIFIAAQGFSDYVAAHPGVRGLARFDKGLLQADVDGNGVVDFEIKVKVQGGFGADDLVL